MAFSGIIPTFQVSSNSQINNLVGGLVDNVAGGLVNVALSSTMGQQLSKTLGFAPTAPQDFLGSIVTPALQGLGSQVITGAITDTILNSKALGPAGPLVAELASQVAGNAFNSLTGGLLGAIGLGGAAGGENVPTRYFPGAGDEEDANYGGYLFTPGPVGPDIVFSIKPANSTAASEASAQVAGNGAGVPGNTGVNELVPGASGNSPIPASATTTAFEKGMNTLVSNSVAYGSNLPVTSLTGVNFGATASSLSLGLDSFTNPTVPGLVSTIDTYGLAADNYFKFAPSLSDSVLVDPTQPLSIGSSAFFDTASSAMDFIDNSDVLGDLDPVDFGFSYSDQNAQADGWKFTTAPGNVTWDTSATADRVPIFGTNQPPVISGSRGMRELSLSDSLIEGFSMIKSVEGKIGRLEALLNLTLTSSYVKVPVYWVCAQDKKYGASNDDGGYFVIKQIKVKEEMRDLTGNSTRVMVDVSFTQVPPYQVDDGRDLASQSVAGADSFLGTVEKQLKQQWEEEKKKADLIESSKLGTGSKKKGDKLNEVAYGGGTVKRFRNRPSKNGGPEVICEFDGKGSYSLGPPACRS